MCKPVQTRQKLWNGAIKAQSLIGARCEGPVTQLSNRMPVLPRVPHATDMKHIKPEAKNDTLTTGCPATKTRTIALLGTVMPVLVHGKQSVFGGLGRHCACTSWTASRSASIWDDMDTSYRSAVLAHAARVCYFVQIQIWVRKVCMVCKKCAQM